MPTRSLMRSLAAAAVLLTAAHVNASGVYITEWMYSGSLLPAVNGFDSEFIEFTNLSGAPVDFTGWSYDDDSRIAGTVSLSGLGLVAAGESVILTQAAADSFRTAWGLAASVKVIGNNGANLGRNDEINLYDAGGNLVDRLTYGHEIFIGSIRTQNISGRPASGAALGANDPFLWVLSAVGDVEGSFVSTGGDVGSPGSAAVPIPSAVWLLGSGLIGLVGIARRRCGPNA